MVRDPERVEGLSGHVQDVSQVAHECRGINALDLAVRCGRVVAEANWFPVSRCTGSIRHRAIGREAVAWGRG
ncbi:MAG TPA: hypothetical protein VNM48_18585, partial [Chloroflexota bacterium]|nr:hypothetical protein [Chloroflexota bacterium]